MCTGPQTLEDVRAALDALECAIEVQPAHVRGWLRPVSVELANTRFRLEGAQRRARRIVAWELWG